MTKEQILAAVAKHGNKRAAAIALGMAKTTFYRMHDKAVGRQPVTAPVVTQKSKGRSLAEFRQTFDKATIIPAKVNIALKALGSGWLYEVEFGKEAGLSLSDLGAYRDQYAKHVVELRGGRRIWAGTAKLAEQLRSMI